MLTSSLARIMGSNEKITVVVKYNKKMVKNLLRSFLAKPLPDFTVVFPIEF